MSSHAQGMQSQAFGWRQAIIFGLIGLLFGIFIHQLDWLYTDANGATTQWIGLKAPLQWVLTCFVPLSLLLWRSGKGLVAPIYLAILLALAVWAAWQSKVMAIPDSIGISGTSLDQPTYLATSNVSFPFLIGAFLFISLPFVQGWQSAKPHFSYERLAQFAWENTYTLLIASVFAGVVFVLVTLANELINLATTHQGSALLLDFPIAIWLFGLSFGMGIIQPFLAQIIRVAGPLTMTLCRVLAYITAVIVLSTALLHILFFKLLLHTDSDTGSAPWMLLFLVGISIVLLNSVVDEGLARLSAWARVLLIAQIIALPILSLIALLQLGRAFNQEGLSPSLMLGLLCGGLLFSYSLAYAVQLGRFRLNWAEGVKQVNPALALLTVFATFLLLTPVLDPQTWSVRQQLARLEKGKVDAENFNYNQLVYQLGRPGQQAIETLKTWNQHPQYSAIQQGIKHAYSPVASDWSDASVEVVPKDKKIDLKAFWYQAQRYLMEMPWGEGLSCFQAIQPKSAKPECILVFKDINADGIGDATLITLEKMLDEHNKMTYRLSAALLLLDAQGKPQRAKQIFNAVKQNQIVEGGFTTELIYNAMTEAEFEQVRAAARAGNLTLVTPQIPDMVIGGQRLQEP